MLDRRQKSLRRAAQFGVFFFSLSLSLSHVFVVFKKKKSSKRRVAAWLLTRRHRWTSGKCKAQKEKEKKDKKGKTKEKGKDKKDNGQAKGKAWTDTSDFDGECGYHGKWGDKKAQCRKLKRDQGGKLPAAAAQAAATVSQVQSSPEGDADGGADEGLFLIFNG